MQLSPFLSHSSSYCLRLPHLQQELEQKGPDPVSSIRVPEDTRVTGPLTGAAAVQGLLLTAS